MDRNNDILNELREISPATAGFPSNHPYRVDDAYWDSLAAGVLAQIHLQEAKAVPSYTVPDGYFHDFANGVLAKIDRSATVEETVQEELDGHSPLLASLRTTTSHPYTVPSGYFDSLSFARVTAVEAPVVPMFRKKIRVWSAYAAAAVVAGIMVTGAFLFTDGSQSSYNEVKNINVTEGMAKLSETEIENYLKNQPAAAPLNVTREEEEPDVQNSLQNMSEEEIQQYLQENNEPGEQLPSKGI